jgi:hypothetical protein
VSAGAVDLPTWRALGADRRTAVFAMVAPATVTAIVGAVAGIVVAIALSPRFPIALTRHYDIDVGFHADWPVLALGAVGLVVAIGVAAWVTAELRVRRGEAASAGRPSAARALSADLPPAMLIGSRLAIEPGRGRRAVPVRSAMVGAIVGVLGFVGCLTFRSGLSETVTDPTRSGIVWDYYVASDGTMPPRLVEQIADDPAIAAALHAPWARAITVKGRPTPMFGTDTRKGHIDFVMLEGHAPRGPSEIVFAPQTAKDLHAHVGDVVRAGQGRGEPLRVVGIALLPVTSHTDYDKSAWVTNATLARVSPPAKSVGFDFIEDYVLVRFRPGADVAAATKRLSSLKPPARSQIGLYPGDATLPTAVVSLGDLRALPFALAVFFALLASATVAHALVTTVRRRAPDLAILRSIGFTRRDARVAIAWQSTLLAVVGLLIGVPLGIIAGRLVWKQLAENFPVVYVPPLALFGVLLVIPIAIAIANALAAGPAYAATRMRPAEVLRTE